MPSAERERRGQGSQFFQPSGADDVYLLIVDFMTLRFGNFFRAESVQLYPH